MTLAIFNAPLSSLAKLKRSKTSWVNGPEGKARETFAYEIARMSPYDEFLEVGSTCLSNDEQGMFNDVVSEKLAENFNAL